MSITMKRRSLGLAMAALIATTVIPASMAWGQEKVVRVTRSPVGAFEGLYIAEQQGYFKEAGITVEITVGGAPTQNIAQLQAGQTDIIMSGSFDVITANAQGLPIKAILNSQDHGGSPTTGLLVSPDSPITGVADLKGKAIGLPGGIQSTQGLMLLRAFEKAGLSKDDARFVNLPFDAMIESAERGSVDAIAPIGLFYALAEAKKFKAIDAVYTEIKDTPAVVFASSDSYLSENADSAKAFVSAMMKAYEYGNANPGIVRDIDTAQTKLPPDYIKTRYMAPFSGAFQREIWAKAIADMVHFGFIPKAPAEANYLWDGAPK